MRIEIKFTDQVGAIQVSLLINGKIVIPCKDKLPKDLTEEERIICEKAIDFFGNLQHGKLKLNEKETVYERVDYIKEMYIRHP